MAFISLSFSTRASAGLVMARISCASEPSCDTHQQSGDTQIAAHDANSVAEREFEPGEESSVVIGSPRIGYDRDCFRCVHQSKLQSVQH